MNESNLLKIMQMLKNVFPDATRLSKSHKKHNRLIYEHFWIVKFFHFYTGKSSFFQKTDNF